MVKKLEGTPQDSEMSPEAKDLMDRFVPHGDTLAVQPIKESKTPGGIILPDVTKESGKTIICRVLRVGPKVECYRAGDTVVCHGSTGVLKHEFGWKESDKFMMLREDQVMGKLVEPGADEAK